MADTRDVGGLMDKAGFQLLTVDVEDLVVDYPDMARLMMDLGWMGEGNAVLGREMGGLGMCAPAFVFLIEPRMCAQRKRYYAKCPGIVGKDTLMAAEAIYKELHGNEDGTIPATFRVIYMASPLSILPPYSPLPPPWRDQ